MGPALVERTVLGLEGLWSERCSEKVTFKLSAGGEEERQPVLGYMAEDTPGSHL